MNEIEIQNKYSKLSKDLKTALSTMELKDQVITIHKEIMELQNICPHNNENFDYSQTSECPYCGKKFGR